MIEPDTNVQKSKPFVIILQTGSYCPNFTQIILGGGVLTLVKNYLQKQLGDFFDAYYAEYNDKKTFSFGIEI